MANYNARKCKNKTCIYVCVSLVNEISFWVWPFLSSWHKLLDALHTKRSGLLVQAVFESFADVIVWIASFFAEEFLQICIRDSYTTIQFWPVQQPPPLSMQEVFQYSCRDETNACLSAENLSPDEVDTLPLTLSSRKFVLRLKGRISKQRFA